MALTPSDIADKNIVDRRKTYRNHDMARTIRNTREKLSERAGTGTFDKTLLKMHARAILSSAFALPLLILLVTVAGLFTGADIVILLWGAVSVALYGALFLVARRIDRTEEAEVDVHSVQRHFLIAHFVAGLGWAGMAMVPWETFGESQSEVIRALLVLLAICSTAVIGSSLGNAVIAGFALPVVAHVGVALTGNISPASITVMALLAAALPFFAFISRHMRDSAVMLLSFRSEKDGLIAELETAKALSDEARRRAEEANLAKSRFLASMSHELRTPLNAILGFSEVMAGEMLGPINNETYRDYARDIHGSGKHLLELINEILDLSRIEAGRQELNEEKLALPDVIEDCTHMMAMRARNKNIRVSTQIAPDLPGVLADERTIRQVVLNLLSNAVKFTPTDGEIVIKVGWTAGGGQYISIKDNGPGIPEDEIPIVLSAFGQGSIAIKSAEQGTGLGLPIVQAIMKLHGGRFDLRSKLREGTEVIATFPASRVLAPMPAVAGARPNDNGKPRNPPMRGGVAANAAYQA